MKLKRLDINYKYFSIKDKLKQAGISGAIGTGIGAGFGLLGCGNKKESIKAGALVGGVIGSGLGLLARKPEEGMRNTTRTNSFISRDLYTPEINKKISELPKEYKTLSKISYSLDNDRPTNCDGDEYINVIPMTEEEIRKQIYEGSTEVILFYLYAIGGFSHIVYNFNEKSLKIVWANKTIKLNSNGLKRFFITEIDKSNKELKKYIKFGEDNFKDYLEYQEKFKITLNREL